MSRRGPTIPETQDLSRLGQVALVATASAYPSFSLWANNPLEFPHPMRLVLISGLALMLALLAASLSRLLGATRWAASAGSIVFALALGLGAPVAARVGLAGALIGSSALAALVVMIMMRLSNLHAARYLFIVLGCVLGIGPLAPLTLDLLDQTSPVGLPVPGSRYASSLESRPDIYVVVVDGFIGLDGAREVFGQANPPWSEQLTAAGFEVPSSGWASYPITIASLPSLFEMDFPVPAGVDGDRALISALIRKLGGENRLIETLNDLGYHTTMIEAGWSWSHCGDQYDTCVPSAFLDEGTFRVLRRSILGPAVVRQIADPFTEGARHAMEWMLDDFWSHRSSDDPLFLFGHVMAPHPPLYLDEDCDVVLEAERAGVLLDNSITALERRMELYLGQAECVTKFMVEFASRTDPDDVVVFVGDHGSDSRNQLMKSGSRWDSEDSFERLSALVAVRTGATCDIPEVILLPNVMRAVLDCISGLSVDPGLEPRMFAGGLRLGGEPDHFVELTGPEVRAVMSGEMRAGST